MVIAFDFWQGRLRGDSEVIGRTLYVRDTPYAVVGIMPPEFRSYLGTRTAFWTPYGSEQVRQLELEIGHELVARLAPGVSIQDARCELNAIASDSQFDGWSNEGRMLGVRSLKEEIVGDSASALKLLMVAVGIVLAIACANLAQLLLVHFDRRMSEFATRKAIGASSSNLVRLALTESVLLSAAGGVGGLALASWLLPMALALAPSEIPRIGEATIDGSAGGRMSEYRAAGRA